MTIKSSLIALGLLASTANLALAESVEIGSEAFNEAVRAYLLEHPEVIFEAVDVYNARQEQAQADAAKTAIQDRHAQIFNETDAIVIGDENAEVAMVEFIDYNCGYCRKSHVEVDKLVEADSDVKIVVRQLPILSQGSLEASKIVLAVQDLYGNEAALQLHNQIYDELERADEASVLALAEANGHDGDEIKEAVEAKEVYDALAEVHDIAESLQISGTPGFIIGDELIGGYIPLDAMQALVDGQKS